VLAAAGPTEVGVATGSGPAAGTGSTAAVVLAGCWEVDASAASVGSDISQAVTRMFREQVTQARN
jgi:hypothetical protein